MHQIIHTEWGQLPAIRLQHASGAHATITLYGAHLVEWSTADGVQRLFCSELSSRDGSKAIRGGVPLIFPQFAAQGDGMRHGFARVSLWRLQPGNLLPAGTDEKTAGHGTGPVCAAGFELRNADLTACIAQAWPHEFALHANMTLDHQSLTLQLGVENRGSTSFEFAAALHSYWQVNDLAECRITGLKDLHYSDQAIVPAIAAHQTTAQLAIDGKIDRIYQHFSTPLTLQSGAQQLSMQQHGFCDAVVWNPGAQDAAALTDMADEEYRKFVCIEAARINPLTLTSGERWQGWQRIEASPV